MLKILISVLLSSFSYGAAQSGAIHGEGSAKPPPPQYSSQIDWAKALAMDAEIGRVRFSVGVGEKKKLHGDVLIGVDALGRFAIAFDDKRGPAGPDGFSDICFLFTAGKRYEQGLAEFLPDAKLTVTGRTILAEAKDGSLAVSLSLRDAYEDQPKFKEDRYDEVFTTANGVEIAVQQPDPGEFGPPMASMSFDEIESWPSAFWYDLLDPDSQGFDCSFWVNFCHNCDTESECEGTRQCTAAQGEYSPPCQLGCPSGPTSCSLPTFCCIACTRQKPCPGGNCSAPEARCRTCTVIPPCPPPPRECP